MSHRDKRDPSDAEAFAAACRIMKTHQQIAALQEKIKNGAEVESVLGSEKIIAAYNAIPKENLPDFLEDVPAIASEHLGDSLVFTFKEPPRVAWIPQFDPHKKQMTFATYGVKPSIINYRSILC